MEEVWLTQMAESLYCNISAFSFKYLGLPVGASPRRCDTWVLVVESVKKKLKAWSPKLLSFGARLILVKSVLSSLLTYLFSLFRLPKKLLKNSHLFK